MPQRALSRLDLADAAKGIAVILMIQVHLTEVFALKEVYDSAPGKASLFLGGPLVAPLFIGIMGYFVAASSRSTMSLLGRGLKILALAFLLNAGLNAHLFIRYFAGTLDVNPWEYLLGVDILFVASLAILILAGLKSVLKRSPLITLAGILAVLLVTPSGNEHMSVDSAWSYLFAFIAGDYEWSYFPLLPWLAYPLTGFLLYQLVHQGKVNLFSRQVLSAAFPIAGLALLLSIGWGINTSAELEAYYHHGLMFYLWTLALNVVWFILLHLLLSVAGKSAPLRYLVWLGRNVTIAYVIQWLLIGNIGTELYKSQPLITLAGWFALILAVTSGASWLFLKLKNHSTRRTAG